MVSTNEKGRIMEIKITIASFESIDELEMWLKSQPLESLRKSLLTMFDSVIEYETADQWNEAVKLCEALAIVGWGKREAVDAISRFNGDCWETKFITDREENRFRFGRWSKKKAGWGLWNPEYFFSPDFPLKEHISWKQHSGKDFPLVQCEKLNSQRNYRQQMPIVMGQIGGSDNTSNYVSEMKLELTEHLYNHLIPIKYGKAVENIYFTLLSEPTESRLKIGVFNSKQKAFYSKLYFSEDFENLSPEKRRDYFTSNLLTAIDELGVKLKKRKIEYDIQMFRSDVISAINSWNKQKS